MNGPRFSKTDHKNRQFQLRKKKCGQTTGSMRRLHLPDFTRFYIRFAPAGDRSLLELEGSSGRSPSSAVADAVTSTEGTSVVRVQTHDGCEGFVVACALRVIFSPSRRMASDQLG